MTDKQKQHDHHIIGGVFGLSDMPSEIQRQSATRWPFLGARALHLANARSALFLIVRKCAPRKVWLPSYLCGAVVDALKAAGTDIGFFPVDRQLKCEGSDWLSNVRDGDCVLRVSYFGFPNRDPIIAEAKNRGAWVIDDAAQALLTKGIGDGAKFVVYSPRKFVGVPDGGFLIPQTEFKRGQKTLESAPAKWWLGAYSATLLRRVFDMGGVSRDWYPRFQEAEQIAPVGEYAMSELSWCLLDQAFDYDAIAAKRRENYLSLLQNLHEHAMFRDLPDGVVPLGFPVRVQNRDSVRNALIQERIYPPIHWALDGFVPKSFSNSHRLSGEIMTLPCDQRYGAGDMMRVSEVFLKAVTVGLITSS
jgi:dTDP-4-amino-4,6-dideoxygalactose transaminase